MNRNFLIAVAQLLVLTTYVLFSIGALVGSDAASESDDFVIYFICLVCVPEIIVLCLGFLVLRQLCHLYDDSCCCSCLSCCCCMDRNNAQRQQQQSRRILYHEMGHNLLISTVLGLIVLLYESAFAAGMEYPRDFLQVEPFVGVSCLGWTLGALLLSFMSKPPQDNAVVGDDLRQEDARADYSRGGQQQPESSSSPGDQYTQLSTHLLGSDDEQLEILEPPRMVPVSNACENQDPALPTARVVIGKQVV